MQPGNRSATALSNSSGDIQRPSWLTPASRGVGTVSRWSLVTITVLLSTRATSRGSVLANQLREEEGEYTGEEVGFFNFCYIYIHICLIFFNSLLVRFCIFFTFV